ncbi:hypothetical protein FRX31_007914 [Thalictrum thalictroides]|uniref:Uncharacterized protein n=1 Tax=Thalictrum thalictroides TaxID=46969 RepID=A0A7J6X149_THATH|nr:hypothetical protein FRX31_007914 [Thalictrum thalictroides]
MEREIIDGEDIDITRFASGQPRTTERGQSSSAAHRWKMWRKSVKHAYLCNLCYRVGIQLTSNGCDKECRNCKTPFRVAFLKVAGCDDSDGISETDLCIACSNQQCACQLCGHVLEEGILRRVLVEGPEYIRVKAVFDKYIARSKGTRYYGNWDC